jgi:hypothetical protein
MLQGFFLSRHFIFSLPVFIPQMLHNHLSSEAGAGCTFEAVVFRAQSYSIPTTTVY